LTEPTGTYLARRGLRAASRRLTQLLVLGYGIGTLLLALGLYNLLFAAGARAPAWQVVALAGALAMLVTLVAPFAWEVPERGIRRFGNWLGHALMTAILVLVYGLFFWPVGALIRALRGADPVYQWRTTPPAGMEGWRRKELPFDVAGASGAGASAGRVGFFAVLVFFTRRGYYLLIPALVVLVSLGIALFFLQTSALAPFIYTLF
jgi:hypothetical protein